MNISSTVRIAAGACLLAVIVSAGPALAQESVQAAATQWRQAYDQKDWPRAIEIGLELCKLDAGNATHEYNLACAYALGGDPENAAKWVKKAADSGFADLELLKSDPDLKSIRERPEYASALQIVQRLHAEERERFKKLAEKSEPVIIAPDSLDPRKPAPVLVVLHGFGGNAEKFARVWRAAAAEAGAILVGPRAVRPAGPRGGAQWGTPDEADYLLTRALETVAKKHKIDAKRVVLGGFSQGGFMTYTLGMRHAEKFRGLIPVAGAYNPSYAIVPATKGKRLPKVFIMVGSEDRTLSSNRDAAKDFEAAGLTIKLNVYDGVGHAFPNNRDEELRKALKFVLAGD